MRLFLSVELAAPDLLGASTGAAAPAHLTVLFLGEVPEAVVPTLEAPLRASVARVPPFPVELRGVGAFPNARAPRILWIGVGEGAEPLRRLHSLLAGAARESGCSVESRPFVPHLTILRVRNAQHVAQVAGILERWHDAAFDRTIVRSVEWKSSQLGPSGAVHSVLARFPLLVERATV